MTFRFFYVLVLRFGFWKVSGGIGRLWQVFGTFPEVCGGIFLGFLAHVKGCMAFAGAGVLMVCHLAVGNTT